MMVTGRVDPGPSVCFTVGVRNHSQNAVINVPCRSAGATGTRRRRTGAFSLVELLVVIAVVALLMSLLVPGLARARQQARAMVCLSNIRSLQIAQLLYADANRGMLVDVGLAHGGSGDESLSWVLALQPYVESPLSLRSPGDVSPYWPVEQGGSGQVVGGQHRRTSYGMNNLLSRTYNPGISEREPFDRLSKIETPFATVQFLLMAEQGDFAVSDHTHIENWGPGAQGAAVAATQVQTAKWGGKARTESGLSNYSYLDGHARTERFSTVYRSWNENRLNPEIAR